jgi:hypothetical protein
LQDPRSFHTLNLEFASIDLSSLPFLVLLSFPSSRFCPSHLIVPQSARYIGPMIPPRSDRGKEVEGERKGPSTMTGRK